MNQQSQASPPSEQKTGRAAVDENAPIGSIKSLFGQLDRWRPQIKDLSPKGERFDFDRFKAVVMSCASRTPKVLLCSLYSIRQAVQAAAELGLDLGGVSGEAFLIPYENRKKIVHSNGAEEWISVLEATFIPGYKGYLRLAYESGLFRDLGCGVVLPDDEWLPIKRGPEKLQWGHTQGIPKKNAPAEIDAVRYDKGKSIEYKAQIAPLLGAYAFVKLKDQTADDIVKAVWFDRLEAIRLRSKAGKNGPWITDYHEMAQKTAIRNLWKHIPKNSLMERAAELDREFDFDDTKDQRQPVEVIQVEPVAKEEAVKAKTSRVADRVRQNAEAKAPPPAPSSRPASEPPNHDGDEPHHDVEEGP